MTFNPRIVFMGTPDFAVPTLRVLHGAGLTPALVISQPDRPKGRGRHPEPPPVKSAALEMGCEVMQPASMAQPEVREKLLSLAPDFFVVVAFGHLLSSPLLAIPRFGAVNLHASLLPKYRGAAPIQRAVMNGEEETGVCAMRMDEGMDTGDILMVAKTPIGDDDTSASLHNRLSLLGADLILPTLRGMISGEITPNQQDSAMATKASMLKKEEGLIDWGLSAREISCRIRGVTPWPGAYTFHRGRRLKFFSPEVLPGTPSAPPGTVLTGFPGELRIAAKEGVLSIREIQGESGKRLPTEDFLRGYPLAPGETFTLSPEYDPSGKN